MKSPIFLKINEDQNLAVKLFSKITDYISKNAAYLKADPNFFFMKYLGRFLFIRFLAYHFAPTSKQIMNVADSLKAFKNRVSLDHDINDAVREVKEDGYYAGLRLDASHVNEILEFAFSNPCYGERKKQNQLFLPNIEAVQKETRYRVASYGYSQENCKAVQEIKHDANILEIARAYLGRDPVYIRSDLLWSFPAEMDEAQRIAAAQVFHCDINDYRSIKFFFYLTDVEKFDGSHSYIKGTHRNRSFVDQLLGQRIASKADEKLIAAYNSNNIRTLSGPAGFGFAGDPYCIHKGDAVKHACRLLFQVEYSFYNYNSYYVHVDGGV